MSINEFQILLDLNQDNKAKILDVAASKIDLGYFFVDSNNGHCYLFDKDGNLDDIKKIGAIREYYIKNDIEKIVIPDSVKNIRGSTFYYCQNLTSIEILNSVENIGCYVFAGCKNLKSINIPYSVTNIGDNAFAYCENLKSITFENRTIDQIKSMNNYPFGIKDESIIKYI